MHPFLVDDRTLAFAHRGGSEEAPENTMRAFAVASAAGFHHLETDVHLTADGVLVAFHDDALDRVTDRTGLIAELTAAEVAQARVGDDDDVIPTLDDLLDAFPEARFNIDAKHDEAVVALAQTIKRHRALERVCVAAFSDERLERLRDLLGARLCSSAGPREIARLAAGSRLPGRGRHVGEPFHCVQVPVRHRLVELVTDEFIATVHARGCQVHVWTIDDPTEMHRLLDMGVDGLMTDRPTVLREVLIERGGWS